MRRPELLPRLEAETPLEVALLADPELIEGLAWGRPRPGHPEGPVAAHVADLLARLEARGFTGSRRRELRFLALVHDSFKARVHNLLPRTGENHHAMRARRFAARYVDDERLLAVLELHDRPYALWRRMRRSGHLDDAAFDSMLAAVPDLGLFLDFVELDGSTVGKRAEPVEWFRAELLRRRPELGPALGPRPT